MTTITLILAIVLLLVTLISSLDLFLGVRRMHKLSATNSSLPADPPRVSLIIPACNEATNIDRAIRSHLGQDYPDLEIIAVNDRSTDGTGQILDELQQQHSRLKVLHVRELPMGWMGKANAMQTAALEATGDFLLFTDGDVRMAQSTISLAVGYMLAEKLDHLALLFRNISSGLLLNSLILDAGAGLLQLLRPWLARRRAKYFVGVGAFNLVRAQAYRAIGNHSSIRMHPIDDVMLGKRLKNAGFRQECVLGVDLVTVPWYASVTDMINGLMKNILAIINYRFALLPVVVSATVIFNILPLWGMLLLPAPAGTVLLAAVLVRLAAFAAATRILAVSPWCTLGTLITPYLTVYILLRAAWLNYRDDGIYWRGTHYSLASLRANEPLLRRK